MSVKSTFTLLKALYKALNFQLINELPSNKINNSLLVHQKQEIQNSPIFHLEIHPNAEFCNKKIYININSKLNNHFALQIIALNGMKKQKK